MGGGGALLFPLALSTKPADRWSALRLTGSYPAVYQSLLAQSPDAIKRAHPPAFPITNDQWPQLADYTFYSYGIAEASFSLTPNALTSFAIYRYQSKWHLWKCQGVALLLSALPHEKSNPKETLPQIENVNTTLRVV
jgi:hypothetical protein